MRYPAPIADNCVWQTRAVIDSHCHLGLSEPDTAELVADAARVGVRRMLTVGIDEAASEQAIADAEARAAQASAAAAAAQAAAQPALEAVAAQLPADLTLTSPTDWDRWLPGAKPYPGASTEEDMSTCPVLSARLGEALGQKMSYWTGTLPGSGCTWVPVPLKYGPDPYDYAYVLSVAFDGGQTVAGIGPGDFLDGVPEGEPVPCPRLPVGNGLLIRCSGAIADTDASWTLALPDARGAGLWMISATARTDAAHTSAEALVAMAEGVVANYG